MRVSLGLLGLALALLSMPVQAAVPDDAAINAQYDRAMAQGDWQAACSVLEGRYGRTPEDVVIRMMLAECRTELGLYGQAITDYRHVIARAHAPYAISRLLVLELAAQQGVIEINDRPAAMLRPVFRGEASLGVLIDSNANSGSSADMVTAYFGAIPLPMVIDEDSKGRPDNAGSLRLSGNVLLPVSEELAFTLRGDATGDFYRIDSAHSRQSLRAGTGLLYREGPLALDVYANAGIGLLGGAVDRTTLSVGTQGSMALAPEFALVLGGSVSRNQRPGAPDKDGNTATLSAGIRAEMLPGVVVRLDYDLARTEAVSALHSNWSQGPRVSVSASLSPVLQLDLGYGYEVSSFDTSLAMFPQGRRDQAHRFNANFTLDLAQQVAEGMSARFGYEYRRVDSTIELYQQHRHMFSAGLTYSF